MGTLKKKNITIGQQIKEALMTQKKLAKMTGIHEVRLSRAINDEIDLTAEEIDKINKILGTSFKLNN